MRFPQILRARRKQLGLTQQDIADIWGIKSVNVSDWEKGKWMPETTRLPALAKRLDLSISELMGEVPIPALPTAPNTGIDIPQYDTGGSMGNGLVLQDQPGAIRCWSVTPEWIQKNVPDHTGIMNLAIVTGFGPSMRPLFNPGDPLLVDRGVKAADVDAIYFFRIGDQGFIKHLQRVPGVGLVAISENKIYKDWVITAEMDFEVLAKVIKVWCGTDY